MHNIESYLGDNWIKNISFKSINTSARLCSPSLINDKDKNSMKFLNKIFERNHSDFRISCINGNNRFKVVGSVGEDKFYCYGNDLITDKANVYLTPARFGFYNNEGAGFSINRMLNFQKKNIQFFENALGMETNFVEIDKLTLFTNFPRNPILLRCLFDSIGDLLVFRQNQNLDTPDNLTLGINIANAISESIKFDTLPKIKDLEI